MTASLRWLILGLLAVTLGRAEELPPAPRLGGPEVVKLDWNTRSLQQGDLDGDGRNDLAVINNRRAAIDLLYQRDPDDPPPERDKPQRYWEPVLEDARFHRQSLPTGISAWNLAIGDLNGDGHLDLAYTGDPDPLTIRYGREGREFDEGRVLDIDSPGPWAGALRIADVNGDGRDDLMAVGGQELIIYLQDEHGQLGEPRRYALPEGQTYNLQLFDADGDGADDLLYQVTDRNYPMRLRRRRPDGGFGPEQAFRIEMPRDRLLGVRLGPEQRPAVVFVQQRSGLIETVRLKQTPPGGIRQVRPRVYGAGRLGATPVYAVGDFDGDQRPDLVASDPEGAAVFLYRNAGAAGLGDARSYPSLTNIRDLAAADVDGDGKDELLVLSSVERVVGIARLEENDRLGYPKAIAVGDTPLALTVLDAATPAPRLAVVVQPTDGVLTLRILARQDDQWQVQSEGGLGAMRGKPGAIRVVDANQDGREDLIVLNEFEAARIILQQADGSWQDAVAANEGFRQDLIERLTPASFSTGDVDGDGKAEMIIARKGFARALRINADGQLETVDQFNARDRNANIATAAFLDTDGDGGRELLLLDQEHGELLELSRDEDGVFRQHDSLDLGKIPLVDSRVLDLDGNGREDLLFLGRGRVWWLPFGRAELGIESLDSYESDLPDQEYSLLAVTDFEGDGRLDLVAIDNTMTRLLEVLCRRDQDWRSRMHFTIFDADPHFRPNQATGEEPREVLLGDFTGDGRPDLVLLIHDRLLLYPQLAGPAAQP